MPVSIELPRFCRTPVSYTHLDVYKRQRSSEETIVSDLTYDLRSGVPDFVDKLVASTFGTMALEAVLDNQSGLMAALVDGRYAMAAIPDPALGPRHVDVATMYNTCLLYTSRCV